MSAHHKTAFICLIITATMAAVSFLSSPVAAEVRVREEVPFRLDSGLTKAEYFISKGKYAEALAESEGVIRRHGPQADAYTYLGVSYQQLGDNAKARQNYALALAAVPTHLGANGYMALLLLEEGDTARAIEQMQVLRAICGVSGCEELLAVESALNAARKVKNTGAASTPKAPPVRGQTPRDVE